MTPYAGVVFDVTDWLSAYSSYTEIFQPQTATDAAGNILDPREGRQYEVGLKAELFDSGVNASLAYFNLRDTNRAIADPLVPGASVAQGEVEVQGIELEASGSPLPGWEVAGGYTYTDSRFLNSAQAGQTFSTYTPAAHVPVLDQIHIRRDRGCVRGRFRWRRRHCLQLVLQRVAGRHHQGAGLRHPPT